MSEQIECVGGPLDGRKMALCGNIIKIGQESIAGDGTEITHIYHYNPTTNTYEYQGVRK